jgi:hypothetical protein
MHSCGSTAGVVVEKSLVDVLNFRVDFRISILVLIF